MEKRNKERIIESEKCIDKFNVLIQKTKNIYSEGLILNLPNIGIQYNNKIVELIHFFENNNMDFYDSELFYPISTYLITLINKGMSCLEFCINYIEEEKSKITYFPKRNKIFRVCNSRIKEYKEIDDKVFSFDIEKDIINAVKCNISLSYLINRLMKTENSYEENLELINNCNDELEKLGLDTKIDESIAYNMDNSYTKAYDKKKIKVLAKKYIKE